MSNSLRPLRPRGQVNSSNSNLETALPKVSKGRVACGQCRRLRQKCDTQRPSCGRCLATKHECNYEAELGETRMQGIRKVNRQLKGEVDTLRSLFERLKSANDETKADIMAQLAANDSPDVILQRLADGEDLPSKAKDNSSHPTSETRHSEISTESPDGLIKLERDDEPPFPPGVVQWHIDKMHYLLQRVESVDLNASAAKTEKDGNSESPDDDGEHKTPEFLQAIILADGAGRHRSPSSSNVGLPPGAVEGFGNLPLSSAVRANYYPAAVQARQLLNLQTEEYRLPSFMAADGSPLSNIFYSYKEAAMEMLSNGIPSLQVLGPSDRIDLELFFRDREPLDSYDVHSWACEILKNLEGYDIFVKLASVALYTTYMRWNILPTATNYALMPEMIRPTKRQRFIPHRMTIDLVPHPAIRDALINRFRDWLSPGTTDTGGTSVGWPYSLDAAVDICPITGRRMLSRAFFEHATNGKNWSLDKSIRPMYPEIEGMGFKIRD